MFEQQNTPQIEDIEREHLGKFPCSVCGSEDNLSKWFLPAYGVESHHCFTPNCPNSLSELEAIQLAGKLPEVSSGNVRKSVYQTLTKRNLTVDTCKVYGVQIDKENKEYVFPYYAKDGKLLATKYRTLDKHFYWEPSPKGLPIMFFGYNTVNNKLPLIICEGEFDALAAYQMTTGKYSVVSVPNGASSAHKFIKQHLQWVESFPKVYLCLDNDDAGDSASDDCMSILKAGKAYRIPLRYKDPNEYLLLSKDVSTGAREFREDIERSVKKRYEGIVDESEVKQWLLDELSGKTSVYETVGKTGISGLDDIFQLRRSELTTVFADPSVGKSSLLRWVVKNLIEQGVKVLVLAMEETPREWLTKVAGMVLGMPIIGTFGERNVPPEEAERVATLVSKFVKVSTINGSVSTTDLEVLVEYAVRVDDIQLVVLDNVTAATADDANVATRISQTVACLLSLGKQYGHHTIVVSHTRRRQDKEKKSNTTPSLFDGFGSGSIERFSHNVISLGRDVQTNDPMIVVRVCKQRATGKLGEVKVEYISSTGCFKETPKEEQYDDTDNEQVRLENREQVPSTKPIFGETKTETSYLYSKPEKDDDPRLPDSGYTQHSLRGSEGLPETGVVRENERFRQWFETNIKGGTRKGKAYSQPFYVSRHHDWRVVK